MSSTSHSTLIYKSTLVASVGGLLFGYDTARSRGFYENLLSAFGYHDGLGGFMCTARMYWGAMYSGKLSDLVGRKKVLMLSGIVFVISSIGTALAPDLWIFVIFRIIGGMGIGIASMLSPMYISNGAGSHKGAFNFNFPAGYCYRILVIYFVNAYMPEFMMKYGIFHGWRWMFGLELFHPLFLSFYC
jgi:SP family arabinose:H+ symporter-like MFS transporter